MNISIFTEDPQSAGLVLGGGGARGCYEIGAVNALWREDISFSCIAGTSIGALVGAMTVQHTSLTDFVRHLQPQEIAQNLFDFPRSLEDAILNRKEIEQFLSQYIFSGTGMDVEPLKEVIHSLFSWEKFSQSDINFACAAFNVTDKRPQTWFKSEMTPENAQSIILASASCFPAFPMLEMDGKKYIDGGYWNNLPVLLAKQMGAKNVLAINVEGPGLLLPYPPHVKVFEMKPMHPLGNFLDFSSANGVPAMHAGYLETLRLFGAYEGFYYTFAKDKNSWLSWMNAYMEVCFAGMGLSVDAKTAAAAFQSLVGWHDSDLSKTLMERSQLDILVEALGWTAGFNALKIWQPHVFMAELEKRLGQMREQAMSLSLSDPSEALKFLSALNFENRMAVVFSMIVRREEGLRESIRMMRLLFPTETLLAWTWHFLDRLWARKAFGQQSLLEQEAESAQGAQESFEH